MEKLINQAIHEPLIVGMALFCVGIFVGFAFCEGVQKLRFVVNLIMGDEWTNGANYLNNRLRNWDLFLE